MVPGKSVKSVLASRKLTPKKKLGQNFLVNPRDAERIVDAAGITAGDTVIEVGVGLGAMTRYLAEKARQVIGIEIDSGIMELHRDENDLPKNVRLIHQDILKTDFTELAEQAEGPLKIVANLPYSISNPLLFKLIKHQESMAWAVLMLQKEVGQRLTASPATKEYGVLSVLLGASAGVHSLLKFGPNHFHPRPKVDSVVVRIDFASPPTHVASLPPHDRELLRALVNTAFQQRRKTLRNALTGGGILKLDRETVLRILHQADIAPETRAERLTVSDYVRLTRCLSAIQSGE